MIGLASSFITLFKIFCLSISTGSAILKVWRLSVFFIIIINAEYFPICAGLDLLMLHQHMPLSCLLLYPEIQNLLFHSFCFMLYYILALFMVGLIILCNTNHVCYHVVIFCKVAIFTAAYICFKRLFKNLTVREGNYQQCEYQSPAMTTILHN